MSLMNFLQQASRSVGQNVTGLVDLGAMAMRPFGYDTPDDQVVGSTAWAERKGFLAPADYSASGIAGQTAGGLLFPLGSAKAPQIADGVLAAQANAAAPRKLNSQAGVYLVSTPTKPNPEVGKRFEREFLGGLAEKQYFDPQRMKGGSLLIMPWDSTNRNMRVSSISDVALPNPVVTTGGQDFARDLRHIEQGIGGASNIDIAKRILDRVAVARQENLAMGGTGEVFMLPSTMGANAENFSTMPSDILTGLLDTAKLKKAEIKSIDAAIRHAKLPKMMTIDGVKQRVNTTPFTRFSGVMTEEGRQQLLSGDGLETSAGELRKVLANRLYLKSLQERLGFNQEDLVAAITDPALVGVPKGYVGNTIIKASDNGRLLPSTHPAYDTDFSGNYVGSWLNNVPVEVAMPKAFAARAARHHGKKADLRTMAIGDLEKSKSGVSEFVDDQTINSLMEYLSRSQR